MMFRKWEQTTFELILIIFIGIQSGPVVFLGFRDCIVKLISLIVALGKLNKFECLKFYFICIITG